MLALFQKKHLLASIFRIQHGRKMVLCLVLHEVPNSWHWGLMAM